MDLYPFGIYAVTGFGGGLPDRSRVRGVEQFRDWLKKLPKTLHDMPMADWERGNRWWLLGVSAVFLMLYSVDVLVEPHALVSLGIEVALDCIWVFYAIDYALTMYVAEHSWHWLSRHAIGFIILLLPLIPGMRFARIVAAAYAIHTGVRGWVRGHLNLYIVGACALVISMGAMVALEAERDMPGAMITSYPDALWWAFVSMTTIGYGVYYPVTMTGRLITVVLVLAGIAIIGVITGSCVAWVIREVGINDEKDAPVTKGQADKLERKLEMLSDKVSDLNRRSKPR